MSYENLTSHILAAKTKNKPVLVRVPGIEESIVKPILDGGATGIIFPQVKNKTDVIKCVDYCKYEPLGKRGYGPRIPSNFDSYNVHGDRDYVKWANENIFTAVMIENKEAVKNLDEILLVPGLDAMIIGPADLSISITETLDVDSKIVVETIDMIIKKTIAAGLISGIGIQFDLEKIDLLKKKGVQLFQIGNDFSYMKDYLKQVNNAFRKGAK